MIEILWNGEVHYRRPSMDDPTVQEVAALIEQHKKLFGFSHYEICQADSSGLVQLIDSLEQSIKTERELAQKTNAEIADLLLEHIWSDLDVFSPQADLVEEAIKRLRQGN